MKDDRGGKGRVSGGFSRRAFLKGTGAAAASTALATGAGLVDAQQPEAGTKVIPPGRTQITLDVNGRPEKLSVEPRMTLLEALRYQLDLTGAKPVSADGVSGASTLWIDDKPMNSSTILAVACVGKKIRTVESLGGDKPDVVPMAFVHNDAQQCGFCTPGFVVAVRAFLDKNPKATEAEIRAGLNGNICRCGTYANIIQAALEVVKGSA